MEDMSEEGNDWGGVTEGDLLSQLKLEQTSTQAMTEARRKSKRDPREESSSLEDEVLTACLGSRNTSIISTSSEAMKSSGNEKNLIITTAIGLDGLDRIWWYTLEILLGWGFVGGIDNSHEVLLEEKEFQQTKW